MGATLAESALAGTPLSAALKAGLENLDLDQMVTFTRYVRVVLPIDGFVFWVRASIASTSALLNANTLNSFYLNESLEYTDPPSAILQQKGALHYITTANQDDEGNFSTNQIIFTSEDEVNDLNAVSPVSIYIGEFNGVRFAFSQRRSFFQQADLYHYVGEAITSLTETQFIDFPEELDKVEPVVSNSLPIWLAMSNFEPPFPFPGIQAIPLYPAMLAPENLPPPYGIVNCISGSTEALASAPTYTQNLSQYQFVKEEVEVTLFGLRNFNAMDWLALVHAYSEVFTINVFGIMNCPILQDDKLSQRETNILAMKKSVRFEINYYQSRVRDVARQLILEVVTKEKVENIVFNQVITDIPILKVPDYTAA